MKFVQLTREEFTSFASVHPLKSFFQTTEMEELGHDGNWMSDYIGVKENNQIIAASRIMSHKNRLGYYYYYAPRGFLMDYQNETLLSFFTSELRKYLKKNRGYMIRIDPTIIHLERDCEGHLIKEGINNEHIVEMLKKYGYIHHGYSVGYDESSQCRWVYCLDLKGKTEEEILKEMRPTARNQIKKTANIGAVHIRELSFKELALFKKITEEASIRRGFHDKPLSYYEHMYQLFSKKNEVKFMIAELYVEEYITNLEKEIENCHLSFHRLSNHMRNEGKKREIQIAIDSNQKKLQKAKELLKQGTVIPLAAAMFLLYGDEILYYHSGNYPQYIEFNGQRMIQWYMIKYALQNGFKRYNFYGISGIFDEKDSDSGVYEFKKGFGGYVEEYIGDFDLPISFYYYIQKLLKRH